MTDQCHCNSGQFFTDCCAPLLNGTNTASTPESLMRSRYTAFCVGNIEYLLRTHLTEKASADEAAQLRSTIANTQWLNLEILHTETTGDRGVVEFAAHYKEKSGLGQLHERSNFLKKEGHWFYTDGIHLPAIKPQRNAACWCGSGKKFKKCCGL